jgi:hypothetical protein
MPEGIDRVGAGSGGRVHGAVRADGKAVEAHELDLVHPARADGHATALAPRSTS